MPAADGSRCADPAPAVVEAAGGAERDEPSRAFEARMRAGWLAHDRAVKDDDGPFHSLLGDAEYWEDLYASTPAGTGECGEAFDWLATWSEAKWLLEELLEHDRARSVLHLGCGNSRLPQDMHDAGYINQTSVDVSPTVVKQMSARNRTRPAMRWHAADCTNLGGVVHDEAFDLVVDKGTFDAITCHDLHAVMLARFLREASRVTRPGGVYVCISLHEPRDVPRWLRRRAYGWRVRAVELCKRRDLTETASGSGEDIVMAYVCTKRRGRSRSDLDARWRSYLERVEARPDSDVSSGEEESDSDHEGGREGL